MCAVFAGYHMNDTSGLMKTLVNDSSGVAVTTAISVGVVLGIVMTLIVIVSIIAVFVVLRHRRYSKHFRSRSVDCVLLANSFNGR